VIVENTEITLAEASTGNIFSVRNTNQLTLKNNILDAGDAGDISNAKLAGVLDYHVRSKGKETTFAPEIHVDIDNNLIRGHFLFSEMGALKPVDISIKGNLFEHNNNAATIKFENLNDKVAIDASNSSIVLDGNTFNTLLDNSFGNYLWLSSTPDAEDFTMVLKNNTFIRTSKRGANYAIAYHGSYTVDASENNVFDGYMYNIGFHDWLY